MLTNALQPGEYSKGGGLAGILYNCADSDGDLNLFNVESNDDGLWLNSNNGRPDNEWNPDNQWVFLAS